MTATATVRRRAAQLTLAPLTRPSALPPGLETDELLVDNFAGGGGASTGIELALGRSVDIAINHDPDAIAMHARNHPHTTHYAEDVWHVDPVAACHGRRVGVAWFSPDCTHFARARGCKPVSKKIRALAWVITKWARKVAPRVLFCENVSEFESWGPVIPLLKGGVVQRHKDGSVKYVPDPKRKGRTFKRFVTTLRNLGYDVEWRVLNAAEYGAPTARRRFFLVARNDGLPIRWPKPTHGHPDSSAVRSGRLKPFRMAAECIDFSAPCPSIFRRKKPLAENTEKRLVTGVRRFILDNPDPFLIPANVQDLEALRRGLGPLGSAGQHAGAVVVPFIARICHKSSNGPNVKSVGSPLSTIVSKNEHCLIAPVLLGVGGPRGAGNPQPADQPLGTVMPDNHRAVATAFLTKFYGTAVGSDLRRPMPSITAQAGGGHMAEVRALLARYEPGEGAGEGAGGSLDPVTVTIRGERYVIVDIGLRMLSPRELAYAQFGWAPAARPGGPERPLAADYELTGTQANQVAKIGNSVPPLMAAALVRENVLGGGRGRSRRPRKLQMAA